MLSSEGSLSPFPYSSKKGGGFGGMFGMLKGLVGSKSLSCEDMEPVLDKMKDHLIGIPPCTLPWQLSTACVLSLSFISDNPLHRTNVFANNGQKHAFLPLFHSKECSS